MPPSSDRFPATNEPFPGKGRGNGPDGVPASASPRARLPLLITLLILFFIPLVIISRGYLPPDDALRHAAKAVSGKPWSEILVLRPDITMDSHPGWHAILGAVHGVAGGGPDVLVVFGVVAMFVLCVWIPAWGLRRPETWLTALSVVVLARPDFFGRLMLGRPFMATMAAVLLFGLGWRKVAEPERMPWPWLALFAAAAALAAWIHGSWYLLAIPVAGMLAAREWRGAWRLSLAWGLGILAGACLTGRPALFLWQMVHHLFLSLGGQVAARELADEFLPTTGDYPSFLLAALVLLARRAAGTGARKDWDNPLFLSILITFALGFKVYRFWFDFGLPLLTLWLAVQLQEVGEAFLPEGDLRRTAWSLAAAGVLFLQLTPDVGGRWTDNANAGRLSLKNPAQAEWLPEPGGIFYSDSMNLFYPTFFENPDAGWRYMTGFEPGWMPPADLAVYRDLRQRRTARAFAPWIAKMRPPDRLIIYNDGGIVSSITPLEWKQISGYPAIWSGRIPRQAPPAQRTDPGKGKDLP